MPARSSQRARGFGPVPVRAGLGGGAEHGSRCFGYHRDMKEAGPECVSNQTPGTQGLSPTVPLARRRRAVGLTLSRLLDEVVPVAFQLGVGLTHSAPSYYGLQKNVS